MAPYPRHSSIDYALRSKRPVNRTVPLLHHGFGADKKVLPIFLVFHPLAARLAPRSNGQQRHSDSLSVLRIPGRTLLGNSGRSPLQPLPVPDILRWIWIARYIPASYLCQKAMSWKAK